MNSFSPTKTVSNSKTAVRFAVDFIFIATSSILLIATNSDSAFGAGPQPVRLQSSSTTNQPTTSAPPAIVLTQPSKTGDDRVADACMGPGKSLDSEECKNARMLFGRVMQDDFGRNCEKQVEKIGTLFETARKACSNARLAGSSEGESGFAKCFDQIQVCTAAEREAEEIAEESSGEESGFCSAVMANKCFGLPRFMEGRNFADEEKESERERIIAKRAVDELAKERRDAQREMLTQQRELQEAQQDAAFEVRNAEREIAKEMSNQFKEVQDGQRKSFDDAQRAYQEMDAAYIKMRDESRQHALKVEEAKDKFHGQCIAQAESQFKIAEQARQAANRKRKKNAGSATRLAGSRNRKNLNQTAQRNFDFNAYLNECLNGQTGVGKSLANAVRAAEREKAARDQSLKEQSALIEQQRQTMLKKLMELESVAEGQNAEIVKQTNERLQNLNEEQQRISAKNQARLTEFMQNQQLRLNDIDQRISTESELLQKYTRRSTLAGSRAACTGGNATRSEGVLEKIAQGWNDAQGDIMRLEGQCKIFKNRCDKERTPATSSFKFENLQACTWAEQALDPKRKRTVSPVDVVQ